MTAALDPAPPRWRVFGIAADAEGRITAVVSGGGEVFLLGLGGLVTAPFAPQPLGLQVLIGGVLIAAAWAVFESWRVWRADPDRQPF